MGYGLFDMGVVKLLNGSPVVGATIHLRSEGGSMRAFEQKQQTSHSGEYSFKEISSGSYRIEVYPPAHLGEYHTPDSPLLAVAENQVIKNDVILLISEFIVVGSVTYDDGSPVMDAHVGAYRTGRTNGSRRCLWTPRDTSSFWSVRARGVSVLCTDQCPCQCRAT